MLKKYRLSKTKNHARRIKFLYGITREQYEELRKSQNYRCKICLKGENRNRHSKLYINHCHATGIVRGLLCHGCNLMLGAARDKRSILVAGIIYLKEFEAYATAIIATEVNKNRAK